MTDSVFESCSQVGVDGRTEDLIGSLILIQIGWDIPEFGFKSQVISFNAYKIMRYCFKVFKHCFQLANSINRLTCVWITKSMELYGQIILSCLELNKKINVQPGQASSLIFLENTDSLRVFHLLQWLSK